MKKLKSALAAFLIAICAPNCYAGKIGAKENKTFCIEGIDCFQEETNFCFTRGEVEEIKNDCESLARINQLHYNELQNALDNPPDVAFYQEPAFVGGLAALTLILTGVVLNYEFSKSRR